MPLNHEQRHALVLRAWEATNTERELHGVLDAVCDVLVPAVPFVSLAIVSFQGERHDLYAAHVIGVPHREGETLIDYLKRAQVRLPRPSAPLPARKLVPYNAHTDASADFGYYACPDLFKKEGWWEHEFELASSGIRSYVAHSLVVRGRVIGVAVFSRLKPVAFTPDELALLFDTCRALSVAVANALANEEILRLRDELQAENIALRERLGQPQWSQDVVGASPALRRVLDAVDQVAETSATVLITGETGTGKELVARAIHQRSPRADGPLVKVNCSAIPDTLLAAELFGYERGAFTGATERRKGRFEKAHGGTLFLDEIAELPPDAQVLLLRVLQEREFERLGGGETVHVDVRVVAATNRDLAGEVRAGRFRSDLYYRLNVFPIAMPALRERLEDVPVLVAHFAAKYGGRFGRPIQRIDRRSMSLLRSYSWPGNVRELENIIERAVITSQNGTLRLEKDALPGAAVGPDLSSHLRNEEREAIESALQASGGRISGAGGAAKRLGLAASTLEFRIRRLGIRKFDFRR